MTLKLFKDLKKQSEVPTQVTFKKHIVWGQNLGSIILKKELDTLFGEENVALLAPHDFDLEVLKYGQPSSIRGESNISALIKAYPEISLSQRTNKPLYYKDQKFREYDEKFKSFEMKEREEGYLEFPFASMNLAPLYGRNGFEVSPTIKGEVLHISTQDPSDLIDQAHWLIECTDGTYYSCEKLYVGHCPATFAKKLKNKAYFSKETIETLLDTQNLKSLVINLEFSTEVTKDLGTVFLPQSQTHDWGHFIGEFEGIDEQGHQKAYFSLVLENEEINEEEVARKIRLLKKVIERVYQIGPKEFVGESILLTGQTPFKQIDDDMFDTIQNELSHVYFVGYEAPLSKTVLREWQLEDINPKNIHSLTRELLSSKQVVTQIQA